MRDPYQVLGVSKSASTDEIKSVYRKLAKKFHPDMNPGRKDSEQRFKEISAAYDLLSDPIRKSRFDRGEIDADGNERGFAGGDPFGQSQAGGRAYQRASQQGDPFSRFTNLDDLFAEFARGGASSHRGNFEPETNYILKIPFTEACLGIKKRVSLQSGKVIDVKIPAGVTDGYKLRLKGLGAKEGARQSDVLVEIRIDPHPYFQRKDQDILLDVPITIGEALLGATIKVPTLDGFVSVKIPKGANSGSQLRLKGKGITTSGQDTGDLFVRLSVALPEQPSDDLTDFVQKWSRHHPYDPRKKFGWE